MSREQETIHSLVEKYFQKVVSKIDKELLKLNHKKIDEYIDQLTDTSSKKKKNKTKRKSGK